MEESFLIRGVTVHCCVLMVAQGPGMSGGESRDSGQVEEGFRMPCGRLTARPSRVEGFSRCLEVKHGWIKGTRMALQDSRRR